jgi:asparagine N-glycosylation enzyme membrane subunit Stt3
MSASAKPLLTTPAPEVMGKSSKQLLHGAYAQIVTYFTLLCICIMASSVRLFSVIKYESVIHEFDPYFNYRCLHASSV